jgi:hypothetical protein
MKVPLPPITWQLRTPGDDLQAVPWLEELQGMRGRILHDVYGLPEFRRADGTFADPDPMDMSAYHVLAWSRSRVVGCVRAMPLDASLASVGDSLLGRDGLDKLLRSIGTTRWQTFEVSRWLVQHEYASANVAIRLIAGMWAVLRCLRTQKAICMAGTRDGRDRILIRLGGQHLPGFLPIISSRFRQTIVALWFDVLRPPAIARR